jgi:hypothetical protein
MWRFFEMLPTVVLLRRMKAMRLVRPGRVGWSILLLLVSFALIGSCGIPSTSYLPPIAVDQVVYPLLVETSYSFVIPDPSTTTTDIFEGFEVFYKLFRTSNTSELFDANGDASLSDPVSHIQLRNAGYSRLARSTETASALPDYPLIPLTDIEKDDEDLIIELNLSNIGSAVPISLHGNIQLARTLKGSAGERILKGFAPGNFASGDSDLPPSFEPSTEFDITIALYVLSYGNNFSDFDFDIHSVAVYIGRTQLIPS